MIDPGISALIGTTISTFGLIIVAWIQNFSNSPKEDTSKKILIPETVIINKPKKKINLQTYFIIALAGGAVGYGFGISRNLSLATPHATELLLNTSTPTETPTPFFATPTETTTPTQEMVIPESIVVMNNYYKSINSASTKDELEISWGYLTTELQCNSNDKCSFTEYRDWWWDWRVIYNLYDCGSNRVEVELTYTPRTPSLSSTPTGPVYVLYQLIEKGQSLKINEGQLLESHNTTCNFVLP